jgi:subtilase family serine protease
MKTTITTGVHIGLGTFGAQTYRWLAALILMGIIVRPVSVNSQSAHKQVPGSMAPVGLSSLGRFSTTNQLTLELGLPLRNADALNALIENLYDTNSPLYRKYLTKEQFIQSFRPTAEEYQGVIDFAIGNGLTIARTNADRSLIYLTASVKDVERVFNVKMQLYQHPTEARTFYAPDVEPSVPAGLRIQTIWGLTSYPRPYSHALPCSVASSTAMGNAGQGINGSYMGSDFRAAYAPNVGLTGTGQTVGLMEFDGYLPDDISQYETKAGLPSVTLVNELYDGSQGLQLHDQNDIEVPLDIDQVISMAPGLSQVVVFEGLLTPGSFFPNHVISGMVNYTPTINQFCCCWDWNNGPDATFDQFLQQAIAQGQSFFIASGDADANWSVPPANVDMTGVNSPHTVPLDNAYATLVGGTFLTNSGTAGSWAGEAVWNRCNGQGSSGGSSSGYYSLPTWQQGIDMSQNLGSTTSRNVPDVAIVAENVDVILNSTEQAVGGTSCGAPLWAGIAALANQRQAAAGLPPIGFVNPAIYSACKGPLYTRCFHDITVGNNRSGCVNQSPFDAFPGYDLCTGWGTPTGWPTVAWVLSPNCVTAPSGLLGWWRGEGTVGDDSGHNNTGIAQGGLSYGAGFVGYAFEMNGVDADVRIPNSSGNLDVGAGAGFTIDAWITASDTTGRPIVEWNNGSAFGVHLWANFMGVGALFANVVDTTGVNHIFYTASGLLATRTPQHVALTYDKASGNATIYLSAAQVAQQNIGSFTPQTSYDLYLGARLNCAPDCRWSGVLDEVSLYNRALTPAEVANIFAAGTQGKCCPSCNWL